MTYRLVIRRAARANVVGARTWYGQASDSVRERFLDSLDRAFEAVLAAPERWPIARGHIRRISLGGFPYTIYYAIRRNDIVVVAVMHHRRDPLVWRRRVGLNEAAARYAETGAA
ncbi:MAG: type II toxin-antitoxin system RelE/ParE family toxin [Alphaproteobacteria bacterium]|nr:type II toxin-antitoxin system RelE/ParE family toxin [Alphaproteobacteria bacterium]MCW5739176.1 type II toxin-antitoxin system RelE/ParE family toxin [Alphaproteobacteria bacterium]